MNIGTKTQLNSFLILVFISIIVMFATFSCAPAAAETSQDSSETVEEGIATSEEDSSSQREAAAEEEEIFENVDYATVNVAADLKGYLPNYLCTNQESYIKIEITNNSDFTWRKAGDNPVRIGYHYYGQSDEVVNNNEYDNTARTDLPDNVNPGETVTVNVLISDITEKGLYIVQIDPVLEGHFWFSSKEVPLLEGVIYFGPCGEESLEDKPEN